MPKIQRNLSFSSDEPITDEQDDTSVDSTVTLGEENLDDTDTLAPSLIDTEEFTSRDKVSFAVACLLLTLLFSILDPISLSVVLGILIGLIISRILQELGKERETDSQEQPPPVDSESDTVVALQPGLLTDPLPPNILTLPIKSNDDPGYESMNSSLASSKSPSPSSLPNVMASISEQQNKDAPSSTRCNSTSSDDRVSSVGTISLLPEPYNGMSSSVRPVDAGGGGTMKYPVTAADNDDSNERSSLVVQHTTRPVIEEKSLLLYNTNNDYNEYQLIPVQSYTNQRRSMWIVRKFSMMVYTLYADSWLCNAEQVYDTGVENEQVFAKVTFVPPTDGELVI